MFDWIVVVFVLWAIFNFIKRSFEKRKNGQTPKAKPIFEERKFEGKQVPGVASTTIKEASATVKEAPKPVEPYSSNQVFTNPRPSMEGSLDIGETIKTYSSQPAMQIRPNRLQEGFIMSEILGTPKGLE